MLSFVALLSIVVFFEIRNLKHGCFTFLLNHFLNKNRKMKSYLLKILAFATVVLTTCQLSWTTTIAIPLNKSWSQTIELAEQEVLTIRAMRDSDIEKMQLEFVNAFVQQYQDWTLADLGKSEAIDPRTNKPYTSIRAWLEVVAQGEAEDYAQQKNNPNRIYLVAVNAAGKLVGYTSIIIMHAGTIAYMAQGYISPLYQKCGYFEYFMNSTLKTVLPKSASVITLLIRSPHNDKAVKSYEKVGFEKLPKDVSDKYAASLDYPSKYYIGMAKSIHAGYDAVSHLIALMKKEEQEYTTS